MSAVGDPLVDLGILLCYWVHTGDPLTTRPGWFGRDEILERYTLRSRRSLERIALSELETLSQACDAATAPIILAV